MTFYTKVFRVFNENGLMVLGFDRNIGATQGTLEICEAQDGKKFYVFTYSPQTKTWIDAFDVETEILYGGTIVDFCKGDEENPTVYLVCFSDLALLKFKYGPSKGYWIVKEGRFVKSVPKELLLYNNLIPGVEKEVVAPRTPENIKTILLGLVNLTEEPLINVTPYEEIIRQKSQKGVNLKEIQPSGGEEFIR
jgi:hypothetical protein